jgi:hypothetical protein
LKKLGEKVEEIAVIADESILNHWTSSGHSGSNVEYKHKFNTIKPINVQLIS